MNTWNKALALALAIVGIIFTQKLFGGTTEKKESAPTVITAGEKYPSGTTVVPVGPTPVINQEQELKPSQKIKEEIYLPGTKGGPMVLIPTGEFMMGCNEAVDNQCQKEKEEKPYHRVYLDAYYIDKYEVTVAEYEKCANAGKCSAPASKIDNEACNWGNSDRGNHPINCLGWSQASDYCEWAGKRLQTEAEWEYAARGTDGRVYPYGNQFDCGKSCSSVSPCSKHHSTCPVGNYAEDKSPYGVMDMAGNVWEWVADWYDEEYYDRSPARNPQGPDTGVLRVLRGGCFLDVDWIVQCAARYEDSPYRRDEYIGFRAVAVPAGL